MSQLNPILNPIALSVFASRTMAISEEMGAHLGRTALSANIRDRRDYSCALFDHTGALVAQATHIPVHLGSMAYAMKGLVEDYSWCPGDVMVLNDPYRGGTHLPDVTMIQSVWTSVADECLDGSVAETADTRQTARLIGFVACRAHYADIGAGETGSMGVATDLSQEGVLIPPQMLIHQGQFQSEVIQELLDSVHDAALVHGDVRAQLSCCELGAKRLLALYHELEMEAQPGAAPTAASWQLHLDALQAYGEQLAQAAIANIPDGCFSYQDVLDDDCQGKFDIPITVQITVRQHHMLVDFSGTAAMVQGNLNCPISVTAAAVFYVIRCLLPQHAPVCAGTLRVVSFSAPQASLLNAQAPAAVALGNVETSSRIVDVLLGALAQALPGQIPAASQGTMNNLAMASRLEAGNTMPVKRWSYYETMAGGCGASAQGAGAATQHSHMTNTLNTPIEVLERLYPMRVLRYAQRWNSGGQGQFNGGDGLLRDYQFLAPARVALLTERRLHGPWGLAGGGNGQPGINQLNGTTLPGKVELDVSAGDVLSIATPGGGAYGPSNS